MRALLGAALVALLAAPAANAARTLYVPNAGGSTLSVYSVGANSSLTPLGAAIAVGSGPEAAVVTPDGKFLFLTTSGAGNVERYAVGADGSLTSLGATSLSVSGPRGAAVSPDGTKLYVVGNNGLRTYSIGADGTITEVATTALTGVIGVDVAVTPDGRSLYAIGVNVAPNDSIFYVPLGTDGIPTAASTVVASEPDSLQRLAVTPDGRFIYTASSAAGQAGVRGYAIGGGGALTAVPGSPFSTGGATFSVATSPAAPLLFASEVDTDTARGFTIGADGALTAVGTALAVGGDPLSMTVTPSGASMFTGVSAPTGIARFDVASNGVIASAGANTATAAGVGLGPHVSPDQGPAAAFTATAVKGGTPTQFDASGSTDPDGTVARYDWDFGDGDGLPNGGPAPTHTYTTAGAYNVTLTVTDDEGCSLTKTFTGQVVGCNPGAARVTQPVQSLPHPLPIVGLSISKVTANRYCVGKGEGAAKDPAFTYTISDPSNVTLAVQKRVTPQAKPRKICPIRKAGGPGSIPVQFSDVDSSARSFVTVKPTATKKARAAAKLSKTFAVKAGKQTVKLSALLGKTKLKPGWYRVLINGKRADGSISQFVTVKFWVLDATKAKKRR